MFVLAVSDEVKFVLPLIVSLLAIAVSAITAVMLWRVGVAIRKFERMEDKSEATIAALKKDLHDTNVKLIDDRFRGMTHELRNEMNGLVLAANETKDRLKEVDGIADGLNERDHKLELAVERKVDSIKDYIREHTASKNDVQRHEATVDKKFNEVGRELNDLGKQVAVLGADMKRHDAKRGGNG